MELVLRQAEHVVVKAEGVEALVLDVVDREDRGDIGQMVECRLPYGYECSLPVVGMQDLRLEAEHRKHGEDRLREESEALAVVKITVEVLTVEIVLVVDEVVGDALMVELIEAGILLAPGDCHLGVA